MRKIVRYITIISIMFLGTSLNTANAQVLDWLNRAAETVNKATETYNNARDAYNNATNNSSNSSSNNQSSYRTITSVRMISWGNYGSTTTSASIVEDESGTKLVKKGSSTYSLYENGSYDAYSSDSNSPNYYKYYAYVDSKKYYFNM